MDAVVYLLGPYRIAGLGPERWVRVFVPERLQTPAPALFMFDGQNVFHDQPSFSGGWHVHHAVQHLADQGQPAPVVIAIDHGGSSRLDELSPFSAGDVRGQADVLLRWLERRLMPRIAKRFPIRTDPAGTLLAGSSMGGLASLYMLFKRPQRFGAAIAMSPSLWFADRRFLSWFDRIHVAPHTRLYLDGGVHEGRGTVMRDLKALEHQLREKGMSDDRLRLVADPDGKHTEACWRGRFPSALAFALGALAHERPHAAAS